MNIIAVDLGKFNSMFCFYDSVSQEKSTAKAPTEQAYFRSVFDSQHPILVVAEACGQCGWVRDLGEERSGGSRGQVAVGGGGSRGHTHFTHSAPGVTCFR